MKKSISLVKRIMAALAAGTLLIAVPMSGCTKGDGNEKSGSEQSAVSESSGSEQSGASLGNGIVAKSEHYTIPLSVFNYLYNYNYLSFINNYGSSMFDSSKGLDEQYYDETNKITWHDYFLQSTQDYITYIMCFGEGGLANNMALTDAEKKEMEDGFTQLESVAKENSQTLDEYIKTTYGETVTKSDVENIQSISKVGLKYRNSLYNGYKFTDDEYEGEYKENKESYQIADYYMYTFTFAEASEDGTSKKVDEATKNKMKENASALANSKSGKEFNDYLTKYLKSDPSKVPVSNSTTEEVSLTEEQFNSALDSYVSSCHHAKAQYDASTDMTKWIFDESRKPNETKVFENENDYTVVLVEKPLYRDESPTRNVRHILISAESVAKEGEEVPSDDEIKAEAERILDDWRSKDSTEERFAELAKQYSTDTGSATNGGLYENVPEGQMVPSFNDWLFDKNRKPGDTGIVKSDYGYHIMYYVGAGLTAWKIKPDTALRDKKIAADYEELKKKYPVEFDKDEMNKAKLNESSESSQ